MSDLPDLLRIAAVFHDGEMNNDSEVLRQAADENDIGQLKRGCEPLTSSQSAARAASRHL